LKLFILLIKDDEKRLNGKMKFVSELTFFAATDNELLILHNVQALIRKELL